YGANGFALYGLPVPRKGKVLGLLGRNGIGKTTAIRLLAGKEEMNLGKEASQEEIKQYLQGSELLRWFENNKKIAYKPQNLSSIAKEIKVRELLEQRGKQEKINKLAEELNIIHILDNKLNQLSGGELQRVAIAAASIDDVDVYFFDEPLAYLDIAERLRVSEFILKLAEKSTIIVVEHDLLVLDFLTDYLNIFYGQQGAFGLVSGLKSSKYGVNSYLQGFLKEENLRIRNKALNFNFNKNKPTAGQVVGKWDNFSCEKGNFKLDVNKGEIRENHVIGILGRNGTGKTTFVNELAAHLSNKKVSYKKQYLFTEQEEKVRDIIRNEKINKKLCQKFNLTAILDNSLKELSGGELQRLAIARCLAQDADIYLIDEPSAYLDVEERINIAKIIKDVMMEKEKTAFVVDHDLLLISYLADNLMIFSGEPGKHGQAGEIMDFEKGISRLLEDLDITLRKEPETGRPRINKPGSIKDREQKAKGELAVL
ncbi:MAG: ribosome biogenesis/translation initiation ATPase RLI, partial [Candidatus Nanoarchaeia archaeon]